MAVGALVDPLVAFFNVPAQTATRVWRSRSSPPYWLGKDFNHLGRLSNSSEQGKDRVESELMRLCVDAGCGVFDEHDTEAQPRRSPGGGLNPEVRGDATNNQCLQPGLFEHDFKIGSRKCTPMAFGDDEVARLHSGGRNQFRGDRRWRVMGIAV